MAAYSLFSAVQQAVLLEVKDRATSAREKFQAVTERVVKEVVESETFQKHVSFKVEEPELDKTDSLDLSLGVSQLIETVFQQKGERIGRASVFISRVGGLKSSINQIYLEVESEGNTHRTSKCTKSDKYDWDEKLFDLDSELHTVSFDVFDITAGLAIRVMTESVLVKDNSIGQVIIPFERILPSLHEEVVSTLSLKPDERRSKFAEGPCVYELYPLPRHRTEFQAAVRNSANTGMSKPKEPLGYIRARIELSLTEAAKPLRISETFFRTKPFDHKKKRTLQEFTVDVARTQRHVNRQLKRLEAVLDRFLFGPFALTLAFSHARSWSSKPFSILFIYSVCYAILWLPSYLFPMFLFCVFLVGAYLAQSLDEERPVVWNEDIRDHDASLNPMQRVAKLLWVLETISSTLVQYADFFERVINAFGCKNDRASFVVYCGLFFSCFGMSLVAYFVSFRTFSFVAFSAWVFAPFDYQAYYIRFKQNIKSGKIIPYSETVQPLVNILRRIPTTERLGHLQICMDQRLTNPAIIEKMERPVSQ